MRPASSRVVNVWITVLCLLAALFCLNGLASAQAASGSKHKPLQQSLLSAHPVASMAAAKKAARKALPPLTADTWNGTAGDGQWTTGGNWSAGVPAATNAVTIGTASAAVSLAASQTGIFGTLTLSNSGDSLTLDNNSELEAFGNLSNAGTMTMSASGNVTELFLENSITLSGSGTINLNSTNATYTGYVNGVAGTTLTTSSNITGAGTVADTDLNLVNSGTINANISGQTLLVNPDTCTGCASTNTGTLEATGGATLNLQGGTWTQSGAGKITAAASSTVNLTDNVSITGGTLSTTGSGVINDAASQAVFLTNVTNTGNYQIQNNGATDVSGTLTNNGTITMEAAGNVTELYLTGNTTLSGSGTVVLSTTNGNWTGYINGVAGAVLTNQSTITGWGTVGNGTVEISNASNGVINSNISGGNILLNPYTTVGSTNAGLMEATNGGTLTMSNGTWTNSGTIQAAAGSSVVLENNVSITGGTLESTGTGTVISGASQDVFLTGLTLAGTFDIQNNSATEINGTITNNGVINLQATGNGTGLYVTSAGTSSATLTGSGSIVLGTGAGNQFWGVGGASLTIDQGVSGVGNIGLGDLTLTNNSTINANISPTVSATPLTIQAGSGGMANNGTLEATNGGNLTVSGSTITNGTHGVIEALGADGSNNASTVVLTSNVTVAGGTLTTTGVGVIEVAAGNVANLTNLTNTGTLNVLNNGEILSTGTITNNGTITLQASGNQTYFYAPNATVLTGTGTLVMSSTNGSYTGNVDSPGGLTNDETITGAGQIDGGAFTNNGTVNANVSGQILVMTGLTTPVNTKTLEATGGGTLELTGSSWNNAGGTITAGTNSAVDLTGSVTITGGTLSTSGTGSQVFVAAGNIANLTGLTITGTMNVQNNAQIDAAGTITNNGTITLQSSGNQTYFYAPSATVLTGTGTLVMGSTNGSYTGNVDGPGGLTNDETITGAGQIDSGVFTNNGTINANVSGQVLQVDNLTSGINTKTMEATNGGTLQFNGTSFTNTGGTISAATGSSVELLNSASITGGTLTSSGTGQIFLNSGSFGYLSGLTNSGTINAQNNTQLNLTGAITNTGTINILGAGNATYLIINGAVTLNGTGTIDLTSTNGNYTNQIYGAGTAPILISHNTIEGAGNLGSSNMGFTNDGTVDANIAGQTLAINVNSTGFTNYNGTTTTLTGGSYIANGGNITFAAGNNTGVTTLSASVTEEGGGQILNTTNSSNAFANLTSITSTGSFTTDVNFVDAGSFSNAGSLTILGGTSFKVGSLAQISGASLTAGTYVLDSNLNLTGAGQNITTNAANLTLAGGTIENANSTSALENLATNTGKLTIGGNSNTFTTVGNFSNTGTLTVGSGDNFTLGGGGTLAQISGTTLSGGTFVLAGNLNLSGAANITTNSSTLTLEGGTIQTGATNDLLNLATNTKSLTLANGANFTTTGNFTDNGALTVNSGSAFTVLSTKSLTNYHNTGASANTLIGGTYTVAGTLAFNAGATGGIKTDSANITLEGTGEIENSSTSTSALLNLATISSTGSLTLSQDANFTAAGGFTNNGKLTVNSGSTFALTGTNVLTNLASGTLTGGTYTVGGTLQLTTTNGGITTNAANVTLTGTAAKILDGSANALAGLNNNSGSFTLTGGASLTAASSNFTNSGTVDVAKGSTLTVPGATHTYTQTAGTTTIDGTLAGNAGGATISGGTIQGAGTVKGNLTVGGSGTTPTINVGDAGKAGLLSITGTYTQLATGTMTGLVNGTAAGTGFSQLKVTGTAALAGTINFTVSAAFQASLTLNEQFTVLTASSVTGTFSNGTIAINSNFHFNVSYTATGVVLTVASGPAAAPNSAPVQTAVEIATVNTKPATVASKGKAPVAVSGLRHGAAEVSKSSKPLMVAGLAPSAERSNILVRGTELNGLRSWERIPVTMSHLQPVAVQQTLRAGNENSSRVNLPASNLRMGDGAISTRAPLSGWMGTSINHRAPVKAMPTTLPRIGR